MLLLLILNPVQGNIFRRMDNYREFFNFDRAAVQAKGFTFGKAYLFKYKVNVKDNALIPRNLVVIGKELLDNNKFKVAYYIIPVQRFIAAGNIYLA
ncbi:hypothetical protein VF13_41800, partial [Nostoc linckia z16]